MVVAHESNEEHVKTVAARVKAIQKATPQGRAQWRSYCQTRNESQLDPQRHSTVFLCGFLEDLDAGRIPVPECLPISMQNAAGLMQAPHMQPSPAEIDAARARLSAATGQEVWESLPPSWRPLYAGPKKLRYDCARFDFVTVVREMLDCPVDLPLSRLHEVQRAPEYEPCPPLRKGMKVAGMALAPEKIVHKSRNRNKRDWTSSTAYARFLDLYRQFLRELVLPEFCRELNQSADGEVRESGASIASLEEAVAQSSPVLRVVMPSVHFSTREHKDADYGHVPEEINFWVPLTSVGQSNSLFAESFPGRGDFEAFSGDAGDVFRFWGNQCAHYAEPNSTGSTRVSFDFRVIPRQFWDAAVAAGSSVEAASRRKIWHEGELAIGHYYCEERVIRPLVGAAEQQGPPGS